jgi:hypothetical protein
MTFSQKVALAFTIAGFILLIPGTFGLFVVAMFLFQPSIATIGFFLTILMIYLAGGALLRGYLNHFRFKYTRTSSIWLWACTIIYNAVPAAVMSYWSISEYAEVMRRTSSMQYGNDNSPLTWLTAIALGYILAVVMAALALGSDLKRVE